MGLAPNPSYDDYWCRKATSIFGSNLIKSTCTREWFRAMKRAFHCNTDWLVQKANEKNKMFWLPFIHNVVDETIILFKGRWKARQHVRGKPHATGIKLFCIADDRGYIYDFWVYQGKNHESNRSSNTHDYVWDLVQMLPPGREYVVFADQFFGGFDLAETLHNANYKFVLSCQTNRPSSIFKDYLQRFVVEKGQSAHIVTDSYDEYNCDESSICALTFYDSKKCNFLSNVSSTEILETIHQRARPRPEIVVLYNKFMNGVDKADDACHLNIIRHRNKKWTTALWKFLVKLFVTQAHKVKNEFLMRDGKRKMTQKKFLHDVVQNLCNFKKSQPQHTSHLPLLLSANHKGRCVTCLKQGKDSNTTYYCVGCQMHIHPQCWYLHHTGQRVKLVPVPKQRVGAKFDRRSFRIQRLRRLTRLSTRRGRRNQ
ncbi:hypothetical protein AKO1_002875 [Acrasis kona]|uniref:PiggyBac transposable element-derived protein domain-containing protein n=1 Tax=Acrasis kona TaxID=1008807 RepID=A0AAW2YIP7_9EUKA